MSMFFPLSEPTRGKELMVAMNDFFVHTDILVTLAPVLADGVPLLFPIILLVWYIRGIVKKDLSHRTGALYVFSSAVTVGIVNMLIQMVVDKERPEGYIENADMLIMDHLPTAPFPSDHAAIGMTFSVALYLWGKKTNNKILKNLGVFLIIASLVMSRTRVSVAIHRPTDVIVGMLLGALVAIYLLKSYERGSFLGKIYGSLVAIEQWISRKVGLVS